MNKNKLHWQRAKKLIPTGNMFLSKNPSRFIDKIWPTYFYRSKGCEVWDLNKKKYFDMSLMAVGTNILGYANKKVDIKVSDVIRKGNLTTLNCPEEVLLAKKLIKMHPWSDMARFAKTGGEANVISIRLARAYTKKDIILICGYHGWHDWYLAANLENKNQLNTHLFKDLKFKGVPSQLKGLTKTFNYNDYDHLKKIIKKYGKKIAAVKMEVQRDFSPKNNFLKKIRDITKKNRILLIFDECTSGFRENFGGLHLKYRIDPDIALFGKALGNGYPITAIIGKKKIMQMSKDTFISSTFWSDRIGPTAALASLKEMERIKSWKIISKKGIKIKKKLDEIAKKNNLKIHFKGLDALITFELDSKNPEVLYRYITARMLQNGFLAKNVIYVCTQHKDKILNKYFKIMDQIFYEIKMNSIKTLKEKINKLIND
jgi:glutamate-1-semialdehyde 2,1-aminomutase